MPNEIIIRESPDDAYIYKATLKVMLEEDYLTSRGGSRTAPTPDQYTFSDPRLKELNQYSTQLIRENIIPKLTYEVNTSKRYAPLRQVYYSLILAQWFKARYRSQRTENREPRTEQANNYLSLIDSGNLTNLTSKEPYDKQTYFKEYQKSFKEGEYNLTESMSTPFGQSIRRYMSGGGWFKMNIPPVGGKTTRTVGSPVITSIPAPSSLPPSIIMRGANSPIVGDIARKILQTLWKKAKIDVEEDTVIKENIRMLSEFQFDPQDIEFFGGKPHFPVIFIVIDKRGKIVGLNARVPPWMKGKLDRQIVGVIYFFMSLYGQDINCVFHVLTIIHLKKQIGFCKLQ